MLASWFYQTLIILVLLSIPASVKICGLYAMTSVQDLVSVELAWALLTLFFAWNATQNVQSSWNEV